MGADNTGEETTHKKGRHRKKQLYNSILQQMEFYFSDSNLTKDRFLTQLTKEDPFVDLQVFLKFNKIRKLTQSIDDIQKAVCKSELLELSEDKTKICRKLPIKVKENEEECTVYIERIKSDTTHEWLKNAFSEFGKVLYVSIPKYKQSNMNKGFAFIEFEHPQEAQQAINYFESINCRISPQLPPEELCSIITHEDTTSKDKNNVTTDEKTSEDMESKSAVKESSIKKRKRSEDFEVSEIEKKPKIDEESKTETAEDKKKAKRESKKKCQFKEMGLKIMSKTEWKKLRNRYLNMQWKQMKELKQHLNRARFSNTNYDENSMQPESNLTATNKEVKKESVTKLEFVPGVIVNVKLPEPCHDAKKTKSEIKSSFPDVLFVDVAVGSEDVYIRFSNNASAQSFCSSEFGSESSLLKDEGEKAYWEKIQTDRFDKFSKSCKKQRGRDKLLKKAEKELGKHLRFDDSD